MSKLDPIEALLLEIVGTMLVVAWLSNFAFPAVRSTDMVSFFQAVIVVGTLFMSLGGLVYVELNRKLADLVQYSRNQVLEYLRYLSDHSKDAEEVRKEWDERMTSESRYDKTLLQIRKMIESITFALMTLSSLCIGLALYSMLIPTNSVSFSTVNTTLACSGLCFVELIRASGKPYEFEISTLGEAARGSVRDEHPLETNGNGSQTEV